jgi:UDP-2-acetamido-2,6-beta-L-arabino-hexul-4-ose reductase
VKVVVTGAHGFVGKNLLLRLRERSGFEVLTFVRGDSPAALRDTVADADAVVHLAGENRPVSPDAFVEVNVGLTNTLCDAIRESGSRAKLLLASSVQATMDNPYGTSKLAAEQAVANLAKVAGNAAAIYRLPGVFGKWCRPNYNSVVATFCHNMAHDLAVQVHDPARLLRIVYIDDVIDSIIAWLDAPQAGLTRPDVQPEYSISLGELARQIEAFRNCRTSLVTERVGTGIARALYATYVSYLPAERFLYEVPAHGDARGVFVEMLKTPDAGQFSFFTAHPGVTRGSHYHHTKTEKFLVIKGRARFGFRHMITNETHHLETSGSRPQVVETVPGWTHDITNVGDDELVVMLWASEIFDRNRPDTIPGKV